MMYVVYGWFYVEIDCFEGKLEFTLSLSLSKVYKLLYAIII